MNQGIIRKLSELNEDRKISRIYSLLLNQNSGYICMSNTQHANEKGLNQWPQFLCWGLEKQTQSTVNKGKETIKIRSKIVNTGIKNNAER